MSKYINTLINLIEQLEKTKNKNSGCIMYPVSMSRNLNMRVFCWPINCNSCILNTTNNKLLAEITKNE